MNRRPASELRPTLPAPSAQVHASKGDEGPLRTLDWSDLEQTTDWPLNFIVQPDGPVSRPPADAELPVLTELADPSDDDGISEWPNTNDAATLFVPTVFGPKLRRVGEDGSEADFDDSDELYADPDAAPASINHRRSAFANWSFLWLVLLLLGLAAAAWVWWPGLRQT